MRINLIFVVECQELFSATTPTTQDPSSADVVTAMIGILIPTKIGLLWVANTALVLRSSQARHQRWSASDARVYRLCQK